MQYGVRAIGHLNLTLLLNGFEVLSHHFDRVGVDKRYFEAGVQERIDGEPVDRDGQVQPWRVSYAVLDVRDSAVIFRVSQRRMTVFCEHPVLATL